MHATLWRTMSDINIKAQDEVLRGQYANMMQATYTREEFVLDFMLTLPPQGELISRIIVSPAHMKRIVQALADNLTKYEQSFGVLEEASEPRVLKV